MVISNFCETKGCYISENVEHGKRIDCNQTYENTRDALIDFFARLLIVSSVIETGGVSTIKAYVLGYELPPLTTDDIQAMSYVFDLFEKAKVMEEEGIPKGMLIEVEKRKR